MLFSFVLAVSCILCAHLSRLSSWECRWSSLDWSVLGQAVKKTCRAETVESLSSSVLSPGSPLSSLPLVVLGSILPLLYPFSVLPPLDPLSCCSP